MDLLIRVVATQDPAAAQFIPGIRLLPTEKVAGETLLDGNETTEYSRQTAPGLKTPCNTSVYRKTGHDG
jgi:hypothetical protein